MHEYKNHHSEPEKIETFLSQLLIIRDIHNLPLYICFEDEKNDEIFFKKLHIT